MTEFGLPTLDQARARLASIHPEPVMRELVRTETLCPGCTHDNAKSSCFARLRP